MMSGRLRQGFGAQGRLARAWPLAVVLALVVAPGAARAQDARTVVEPRVPRVCATLTAQLAAPHGAIAAADETKLDTSRVQAALDRCGPGKAVALAADGERGAFLSGPLEIPKGVTLLVNAGATLYGSRDPRLYDTSAGRCGTVDDNGRGCKPLIHVGAADAAVMGDGAIDARGGATLLAARVSWWDLAQEAKVKNAHQNCPRIIVAERADNFILYRITLRNSPNFHVIVSRTNGFTAWGVRIDSPRTSRNTDGIDPSSSTNVSILYCFIRVGDDNVAIKAGAAGPASHITVAHSHFYSGHGMSIGSETNGGVDAVEVRDLSIDGADNGLRIKSAADRGGLVHHVTYTDVCIRDVKHPIVIDPFYSPEPGTLVPTFEDILLKNVRVLTPGAMTMLGADARHLLKVRLDGVVVSGFTPHDLRAAHARVVVGPSTSNLVVAGEDTTVDGVNGTGTGSASGSCRDAFVPFPTDTTPAHAASGRPSLVVASDGSGDFRALQDAVDALPDAGGTIQIRPGVYREVVTIAKPHVRLVGDPRDASRVVIVFDKSAGTAGGTFKSATVSVTGDDFSAEGVTFENDFSKHHEMTPQGSQAVALSVTGDRAILHRIRVLGAQDSLYAAAKSCASEQGPCVPARQYFSDCYVEGHVDFIFGDAKAVFHNCEIHAIARKTVYLTAQSKRYPDEDSGYVFDHCTVTADAGIEQLYLGRPWRPYASVVFLDSDLQARVDPAGWREWHPGETHSLDTALYAEHRSRGQGAAPDRRDPHAHQLSDAEAARFDVRTYLAGADGWHPDALVTPPRMPDAPRVIVLWPEGVPGAKASGGDERVVNDRVSNVQVPTLTYFPAPAATAVGTAVIVCPGGAYARLAIAHEGRDIAERLNAIGVTAFVLKYRLLEYGHPAPLQDVLRAIRLVRTRAAEFGVKSDRIGVLGFSAGGHLAASAATLFDSPDGRTGASLDAASARPDFAALVYPVITMKPPFVHAGSRKNLLGEHPSADLVERLSVETQVTARTPPVFLVHTEEDTTVPIENTVAFFAALRKAGVPAEMHLYEKGPHGFGTNPGLGPASEWPIRFEEWLRAHGWLTPA
jgi:polygalacturonase